MEAGQTEDGIPLNRYYLEHPEMVLGTMTMGRSMYGNETETSCQPIPGADLSKQLADAIRHIARLTGNCWKWMPDRTGKNWKASPPTHLYAISVTPYPMISCTSGKTPA